MATTRWRTVPSVSTGNLTLPLDELRAADANPSNIPFGCLPEMRRGGVYCALMKIAARRMRQGQHPAGVSRQGGGVRCREGATRLVPRPREHRGSGRRHHRWTIARARRAVGAAGRGLPAAGRLPDRHGGGRPDPDAGAGRGVVGRRGARGQPDALRPQPLRPRYRHWDRGRAAAPRTGVAAGDGGLRHATRHDAHRRPQFLGSTRPLLRPDLGEPSELPRPWPRESASSATSRSGR